MLEDFRKFIMRGNVLDLAVAVIIGAAFGKIVTSLVNDIIMPPLGLLLGRINFSDLLINLTPDKPAHSLAEAQSSGAATINYGLFINNLLQFIVIAFVVFLIVRAVNRVYAKPTPPAAPTEKNCPYCQRAIPIKAVRCPECTSDLAAQKAPEPVV